MDPLATAAYHAVLVAAALAAIAWVFVWVVRTRGR